MRQIPTLLVTVENADSQQQCPMYIAVSIPQDIFQQGLTKSLCSYAVHNLLFNITHVHILYDARVRKPIIFYHAPLTNLRFIGGIWFKTRFRYPLILCMWGSKLYWGQIEARTGSSRTETTKNSWLYQSGFTCQNLNKPKAFLQMEKITLITLKYNISIKSSYCLSP